MSSSKIAAAVAVCAAVYACAYGGLVYYQGQKFQEYASDLPKYLGSEWKSVKVNITDNGFFSKEFIVLNKNSAAKPLKQPLTAKPLKSARFSPKPSRN